MNHSQRLVLNTVATYGRSVVAVGLTLFSSRWVLNALGQTDFGLFSVVGSIIIFITFLNGVMAGSISRYYAFSIGSGKPEEVIKWFNAALGLHLCLATILTLIGWPIGEYMIAHVLTVPADRIWSCLWVFRVSLLSAFVSMVSIPCVAMFTAQQKITETAFWEIILVILTFTLAFSLTRMTGDLLLIYAIGMVAIIVFVQVMMFLRAFIVFNECRLVLSHWFDWLRFKQIFSFAGWILIGSSGCLLRDQGSAILLNLYFGPGLNSAFGIARQVSAQANQLATSMMRAFSPEITTSEGRGDRRRMLDLAMRASKFGTLLILLFAVPLMVEMDTILKIWLKNPPEYTDSFCRLIMLTFIIDRLTSGFMLAVSAFGRIAAYQVTLGTSLVLTLPLAWLFVVMGLSPVWVAVAFVITMVFCSGGRAFWVRYLLGVSIIQWLKVVVMPCLLMGTASWCTSYLLLYFMDETWYRLILVFACSMIVSSGIDWFWVLDSNERNFVKRTFTIIMDKVK